MRTLIIAPNWIGDAVMSQPLLALLKQQDSQGMIDVLAPPATGPVYQAMAEVGTVHSLRNVAGKLNLGLRWRMAKELAKQHYDRCYVLPNSAKSALVPLFAKIPLRIGYAGEARIGLLNRRHQPARPANPNDPPSSHGRRLPMVEFYAQLAYAPGTVLPQAVPDPRLLISAAAQQAAHKAFALDGPSPLFVFAPGAEYGPAKRWPPRHFASLAVLIRQRSPEAQLVCLGSAKERAMATEIAALAGQSIRNLCGETTLPQALALLSMANGVVSNDSGLMHVAAALRVPQVALFGSSDPRHTPPRSPLAKPIWLQLPCSPCFERQCPLGHLHCLNNIDANMAMSSLAEVLGRAKNYPFKA
jgi:heptosyltransferase II